jgi:hypothetical protein
MHSHTDVKLQIEVAINHCYSASFFFKYLFINNSEWILIWKCADLKSFWGDSCNNENMVEDS